MTEAVGLVGDIESDHVFALDMSERPNQPALGK